MKRVILIVKNQKSKMLYKTFLDARSVTTCIFESLQDAMIHAAEEPHCGILVDMALMIKVTTAIKTGFEDLLNGLPSATLNVNPSLDEIRILPRGTDATNCTSIDQFIDICSEFRPKFIYQRNRESININVLIDTVPTMQTPEKTATINVSPGGCFLFNVRDDIAIGSNLWIKFHDFDNVTVVNSRVTWKREWGTSREIPGIGVRFENIPDDLRQKICASW